MNNLGAGELAKRKKHLARQINAVRGPADYDRPRKYCGKYTYKSERAANTVMKTIPKDPRKTAQGQYLNAYYCHVCQGWHLGHTK